MKINIFIILNIIISVVLFNTTVNAQNNRKTFERLTNLSAKIVRGKILSKEVIKFKNDDGIDLICGHILEIGVSESWKGGNDNFKVFSPHSDIFMDDNPDYFIFARRNANYKALSPKIEFVNCDNLNSIRMDVTDFEYFSSRLKQQIFPLVNYDNQGENIIDEDINMVKKGEWMMLVNRISNDFIPFSIGRRRLNNGNDNIIEEMSLKDFIFEFLE